MPSAASRPALTDQVPVPRHGLYTADDLFAGFDPDVIGSYADTYDARTYLSTRTDRTHQRGAERALHDHTITVARDGLIAERTVMAIMGGHGRARNDPAYRIAAELSARLTQDGVLMASGGGPGIMEATHLGALCAPSGALDDALGILASAAEFPHGLTKLVPPGSSSFDGSLMNALHHWQAPAFRVIQELAGTTTGHSLSIPTWFYGHEPPTPFASHIAKYFANALREDGLLAIAGAGIVYAPGSAGTIQEIFQDAAQNHYESFGRFSPMVFLDLDHHWTEKFPVERILRPLFGDERYERWVLITADHEKAFEFLRHHQNC